MKPCNHAKVFCLVAVMIFPVISAVPQWHSLGLDSHTINDLAIDDMGNLIAATPAGLYLFFYETWHKIENQSLSAQKVVVTGPTRIVAACGNGTDSDGLYQGDITLLGAPFYTTELISYMEHPTALAKTENGQVVYIGNGVGIEYSILDTGGSGYMPIQPIDIPQYSFGVKMPHCAVLHVYSRENILYAGGYDQSPEPGPGHLLHGTGETLSAFMTLNVSALTEGVIDWGGIKLFVGTIDTGIFYRTPEMSMPLQKHSESPNNEPVNDILIQPVSIAVSTMCVAVNSGVYCWAGLEWREIGDIPAQPQCLVFRHDSTGHGPALYAGTNEGVYIFDSSNVAVEQTVKTPAASMEGVAYTTNRSVTVNFSLIQPARVTVTLFDVSGRTVATLTDRYYREGIHTICWPQGSTDERCLSSGVYLVRMVAGNTIYDTHAVLSK